MLATSSSFEFSTRGERVYCDSLAKDSWNVGIWGAHSSVVTDPEAVERQEALQERGEGSDNDVSDEDFGDLSRAMEILGEATQHVEEQADVARGEEVGALSLERLERPCQPIPP